MTETEHGPVGPPGGRWVRVGAGGAILFALVVFGLQTLSLQGYVGSDYKIFHWAATRFLADPAALYDAGSAASLQGYLYPPPSIAFFLPLALGSVEAVFPVFSWLAFLAAGLALAVWMRYLQRAALAPASPLLRTALLTMMLVTAPVFHARGGQVDSFVLLLCVGAVVLLAAHPRLAGALAAVGAAVKIYPALLVVFAAARRDGRAAFLAGMVTMALVLGLATLVWMPISVTQDYLALLPQLSARTIINIYNQSAQAIGMRLTVPLEEARTQFSAYPVPGWARFATQFGLVAVIGFSIWLARRRADRAYLAGLVLATIPLAAPLGWGHAYVYVLPLFCLVLGVAIERRQPVALVALALAYVALLVPGYHRFPYLGGAPDALLHVLFARNALAAAAIIGVAWCQLARVPDARRAAVVPRTLAQEWAA
ncbi:glycosyltransferase family 87 protein [Azoarcus olearius]|uniref:Hypothetical membrane protein n=1 Tax=Azoarcus sp. (strain BH72) TaxID=418699 RepID=A1K2E7_AZOSB|nr:glycosyltransferase family 87 protein [Azoarcus olearius]CAL93002.1 hypothetical membrane protein [Azoarcus olearius]